jgi:3-keto-disaccharide hydrolase
MHGGSGIVASSIVAAALTLTVSVANAQTVTFENDTPGKPPKDFAFDLAGEGGPGRWEVVADKTAAGGKALAQLSSNTAANRFLVAIYQPTVFGNGEVTTRCKPVSGRVDQSCGLIVHAADAMNYYIARSNALESNVRFYRVRNGERQQLATAENVRTPRGQWHTLALRAEGNRYTVSVNGKILHTTTDTTTAEPRPSEGRAGLWVKSDSVAHFERIDITKLP